MATEEALVYKGHQASACYLRTWSEAGIETDIPELLCVYELFALAAFGRPFRLDGVCVCV